MIGAWNPKDYTLNHPSLRVIGLKMASNNGIGYLDGFFNITLGFKEITLIFYLVYNGILNQNMVWSLNIGHFILKYQPCWNLAMKLTPYCDSSWNIGHFTLKYQPCWNLAMKLTPYLESSWNIGHFTLKYQPCWNLAMKLTPYCESSFLWNHCFRSELSDYFYSLMHLGEVSPCKKCFRVRFMNLRDGCP